jgi:hypothetical protein
VISFVQTHRRYEELDVRSLLPPNAKHFSDRYFRKTQSWEPNWDYYQPF